MIPTDRGYIYSPKHYKEYVRSEAGIGVWFLHDIAKWNIAWLSVPAIDLYLDMNLTHEDIMKEIDPRYLGTVTALADESFETKLPGLRSSLLGHPRKFLAWLDTHNLEHYAQNLGGAVWETTMRGRLWELLGKRETLPRPKAPNNVVSYDFTARKRI